MAMLSPTKCEYCYCIGGQQMCVRPKCHLNIEGCVPRYQSGYTCCPSHYNCESASGASTLGHEENRDSESDSETTTKIKGQCRTKLTNAMNSILFRNTGSRRLTTDSCSV
ncbi:hypothetical protein AVEN_113488-1 [Araneus ventricosus]|uniref:VWFC domain-containing protein n=1 Tax=Araneus ventricosus TaxID=182803 RepID=A0A4Y2TJU0_ARAVE|nr:hypothetical protein AVEN_113488-1 [Araneus ventricosus]